jgi:glycosyltransferase involved in cell wall biosynthesis
MQIAHIIANVNRRVGGPSQTVPRLAVESSKHGHTVQLFTLDYPELGPLPDTLGIEHRVFQPHALTRRLGAQHGGFKRALLQSAKNLDVIHNHGLWLWPNHYAAHAARSCCRTLVLSPRGMLGSWALSRQKILKSLLWHAREKRNLDSADGFHATSGLEAEDIRRLGFRQPVAVIPNGMDVPPLEECDHGLVDSQIQLPHNKRLALFLSRIHPKKGIEDLLRAWSRQTPAVRDSWHLLIAGPDANGYAGTLRQLVHDLRMENSVQLHGEVTDPLKGHLYRKAELFLLPTYGENFGMVVAEALAHGTTVLTTQAAPWPALEEKLAGWSVPCGTEPLDLALKNILPLEASVLKARGLKGRAYVLEQFAWDPIAVQMLAFYTWLQGRGERPPCVLAV